MATVAERARVRKRLEQDFAYYAPRCLQIVDAAGLVVPLLLNRAQLKLEAALAVQRAAGEPERAIVLKARKVGISTAVQGKVIHRATQRPNHRAQVVAHDNDTAGALFDIGKFMWAKLPQEFKPQLQAERNSKGGMKYMAWGEPSAALRRDGFLGLNSTLEIDTAKEVESGRGLTIHTLHLSEVAFWRDVRKMTALLNAVPDDAGTLIVHESTANGANHFKDAWDRAEAGESAYAPVFVAWFEDERYVRLFASGEERAAFVVGEGSWGEEEPDLVESYGCSLEQLNWRRWTIVNKCESNLDVFHQEYPSTPEQAFLTTGRQVFSKVLLGKVREAVRLSDPVAPSAERPGPQVGSLVATERQMMRGGGSVIVDVPRAVRFERGPGRWRVWEQPVASVQPGASEDRSAGQAGQYVVGVDPMSGEENSSGELAWHGVQVINHRSRAQAAEHQSRLDPDELAMQVLLAALHWNRAWVVVEVTGGYGLSIVRALAINFKYPYVYTRQQAKDQRAERYLDRLGWSTDSATKPMLIDHAKELLRTGRHGVRSRVLAGEMLSFVRDERGRTRPEHGKFSDLLMAWMIAQQVAQEKPLRPEHRAPTSTSTRRVTSSRTGY